MSDIINSNKYLLKTKDIFLVETFITKLLNKNPGYKVYRYDNIEEFINRVLIIDLFDNKKKILVLNNLLPDFLEPLSGMIHCKIEDILILVQQGTVPRTKPYTIIKGVCQLIEYKKQDASQCAVWVRKWLKDFDVVFSEDIPFYIVECLGNDVSKLKTEVNKIKFYFLESKDKVLTKLICTEIFTESNEANYFLLIDHFLKRHIVEVCEELKKVDEYSFVKLNHMIINQVEKIYKVIVYKEQKLSTDDICDLLNVPKYILKTKLLTFLSYYNKVKLIVLLDYLNELDTNLRLSKFNKRTLFESYLLRAMKL